MLITTSISVRYRYQIDSTQNVYVSDDPLGETEGQQEKGRLHSLKRLQQSKKG